MEIERKELLRLKPHSLPEILLLSKMGVFSQLPFFYFTGICAAIDFLKRPGRLIKLNFCLVSMVRFTYDDLDERGAERWFRIADGRNGKYTSSLLKYK
ncbi:MAG: hypothetical protein IJ733_06335 [Lachnospiraceae bacterium]|nr:hypothetical protein [Lachnospiraceae bacterium]